MTPTAPEPGQGDATPTPAAIAATENPIRLDVALIEDERVPSHMVCMGTYRDGRLVARSVMTPEAWAQIEERRFFDKPLQVVLVGRLAPPGLQCQLFAMVPLPAERSDDSEEPWAASLPGASYEATLDHEDDVQGDPRAEPVPLGIIVRYDRDRVHPGSLPLETADVLKKIVEGDASEVLDRALADLLGLDGER
jgi:hypothetical protein